MKTLGNISINEFGYFEAENSRLNILYPIDYSELEVLNMINKIIDIFQNPTIAIKEIVIKNSELSVRLFLYLMEVINKHEIVLYLTPSVYEQFKIKNNSVSNLTKINTDRIKVINE